MSKFQLILTSVFAAFIIVGVLVFSFARSSSKPVAHITLWGTIPEEVFHGIFEQTAESKDPTVVLSYVEKNPATFDADFVDALASGTGPDAVLLPHDEILKNRNKLFTIPFSSYSERTYRDTFVDEGSLFLNNDGIIAVPLVVDPLVMYWNRDTFNSAGIAKPPAYWDEFYNLSTLLTTKDGALNITRSAVALGGFKNINNAKDIISMLLMQAGDSIVSADGTQTLLGSGYGQTVAPAVAALTFYTEFSNPAKSFYSWNPSLTSSQDMFVSGDLATYIGFASELATIRQKNPNLNFDVATIPQSRTATVSSTFGSLDGLAIVKNSKNVGGAFLAIAGLTSADGVSSFVDTLHLAPARRDLLAQSSKDANQSIFNQSALWSRGWFDPDSAKTARIFETMIETVTGGQARLEEAISKASQQINTILQSQ